MRYVFLALCMVFLSACSQSLPEAVKADGLPEIFPDYTGVTVPFNIAPLNFQLVTPSQGIALLEYGGRQVRLDSDKGVFSIPSKVWRKLLGEAKGDSLRMTVYACREGQWLRYAPFAVYVAEEAIDPYLVYRRIAPGYRMWNAMGIYQRNLETFDESAILENRQTDNSCMNCHSFCRQDPGKMLFHQRSVHAGTYFVSDGEIEKLDTRTDYTISALVYTSWHPSGRFVAFSTNETKQDFHLSDPNRIEVFDIRSDVVIYDVEKHEIFSSPLLSDSTRLETFPTFSPDGKRLYFCSAPRQLMPDSFRVVKYDLLSLPFDPDSRTIGRIRPDTLYNSRQAGGSARFPRVSPDGKYLLYTVSAYGNFSIWHKDADLRLLDLATGRTDSLPQVNSRDVESYHSWSSNSRWFVFSSRRENGLYTRPYLCHIDSRGIPSKPFLLPQQSPAYYARSLFSFNIPELVKGKINVDPYRLIQVSKEEEGRKVTYRIDKSAVQGEAAKE